jgi:hypothetical protein
MARYRMIKPEFWNDEKTGMMSSSEKCLFLGMLNFSDDEGLIRANPAFLKSTIFPYDSSNDTGAIVEAVRKLADMGLIYRYIKNQQSYLWIIKFRVHQRIDKPGRPANPAPDRRDPEFHMAIFRRDSWICSCCGEYCDLDDDQDRDGSLYPVVVIKNPGKSGAIYPTDLEMRCLSCCRDSSNVLRMFQERSPNTPERSSNGSDETKLSKVKLITNQGKNGGNPSKSADRIADASQPPVDRIEKIKNRSKHYKNRVGSFLEKIESSCSTILQFPQSGNGKPFNGFEAVTWATNQAGNPKAISETIEYMAEHWDEVENPWGWFRTVFAQKNAKENENLEIDQSLAFKENRESDAEAFKAIWESALSRRLEN